jgi:pimeloyl-ACP methyl ester carboxylesterase
MTSAQQFEPVRDFRVAVPDEVLEDLDRRLALTRWPDEISESAWRYGTNLAFMRELAEYWRGDYDWRAQEARINAFSHFTATCSDIDVHFIHERALGSDALPLLLLHGWPSSFWEFNEILPLLTQPAAGSPAATVVAPSLPGYGFSYRPFQRRLGIIDCADLLAELMTQALGYERFAVVGGDWGAYVAARMAHAYPQAVVGLHLNMLPLRRDEGWPESPTDEEREYLDALDVWQRDEAGYSLLQGTRPQTPAYALTDSPVGLAAWLLEKFALWSDSDSDPERVFSRDDLLTNVMIYWVTGAIGSSFWPYFTRHYGEWTVNDLIPLGKRLDVPTYYIDFPHENIRPPRSVAERLFDIRAWEAAEVGGHFPALEQPDALAAAIRRFVGAVAEEGR